METYHFGAFLFRLLTDGYPYKFEPEGPQQPQSQVLQWVLDENWQPTFPTDVGESTNPAVKVLVHAIRKAMAYDADKRISSRSLAESLDIGTELVEMLQKT